MFLKIFFEILLIGLLAGGSYYGIKMGFFNIAAKPIKFVLGLVFAFSLCNVVGTYVIAPMIQAPITNYIKEFMYANCANLSPANVVEEMPTLLKMAGAAFDVEIGDMTGMTTDAVLENIIVNLTSPAVVLISIVIAFVLLFLLSKLLFSGGILLVNSVFDIGILGKINRIMGFVLAGLLAILAAWALVGIVDFFFHLAIFDGVEAIRSFKGGWIYRLFNSLSPIELLLSF